MLASTRKTRLHALESCREEQELELMSETRTNRERLVEVKIQVRD